VAAGDGAKGAAASPAAKPKWLTISGLWDGVTAPWVVDSASGRGWIGLPRFSQGGMGLALSSLRRTGGKLTFAKAVLAAQGPMFIVGSQLFFHLPSVSGFPGELQEADLLANGTVGTPRAVPDDPEKIPPQQLRPAVGTALPVGDRLVWLLSGAKMTEGGNVARTYLWACCSTTGELRELTRFIKQGGRNVFQLGLDSKKQLWLAWLHFSGGAGVGSVKLLELDRETLAPRTPRATTLPGDAATGFELSCAAFCRVVMSELSSGDLLSSSPRDRSPIRMPQAAALIRRTCSPSPTSPAASQWPTLPLAVVTPSRLRCTRSKSSVATAEARALAAWVRSISPTPSGPQTTCT